MLKFKLYLTDYFIENLGVLPDNKKWEVYTAIGLVYLNGKDRMDEREEEFRGSGATVPFYFHPYVQEYGHIYLTYMACLRFMAGKKLGFYLEAGEGPLMNFHLGASFRF